MEAKEAAIGPQGFPRGLSRSPVLALIRPSNGESLGRCGRGPTSQQAQRAWGFGGGAVEGSCSNPIRPHLLEETGCSVYGRIASNADSRAHPLCTLVRHRCEKRL